MSNKVMLAVWGPGSGTQWWRTGMTQRELKAQDTQYFSQGLRLAAIDIFKYSDVPLRFSYSAVWQPGTSAQYWRAGMSVAEFKSADDRHFSQGRRIALLDVQHGRVFAVWRPGSGTQFWRIGMTAAQLRSQDQVHFANGLRLRMLKKHGGNSFAAVWQEGSGAQFWRSGMTGPTFNSLDTDFFSQGLRLSSLDTYAGKFIAVWRPGSGSQWVRARLSIEEIKAQDIAYFQQGLRLRILRAKRRAPTSNGASPPSQGTTPQYWATVENGACYNPDGTVSTILTPGILSATAAGATIEQARENAKRILASQACLTTSQQRSPGCCTYRFR